MRAEAYGERVVVGHLSRSSTVVGAERLNRRLIYVGMTRASHELVLTASGNHPYIADLEA